MFISAPKCPGGWGTAQELCPLKYCTSHSHHHSSPYTKPNLTPVSPVTSIPKNFGVILKYPSYNSFFHSFLPFYLLVFMTEIKTCWLWSVVSTVTFGLPKWAPEVSAWAWASVQHTLITMPLPINKRNTKFHLASIKCIVFPSFTSIYSKVYTYKSILSILLFIYVKRSPILKWRTLFHSLTTKLYFVPRFHLLYGEYQWFGQGLHSNNHGEDTRCYRCPVF